MNIGFVGLGNMGASIARDLIAPAHTLMVYDIRSEILAEFSGLGAKIASSVADLGSASDVVGICVRTDEEVLEVVDQLLYAARPGLIIAIHSTIHLATLDRASAAAASKGVRIVDAPVSRGTAAPKSKAIVFMVGGDPADVASVVSYVRPAALKVIETGRRGSAMTLKICNNVITYLMVVTLRDVFRLIEAAGVDPRALAELASTNGVAGPNMMYSINRRAGLATPSNHVIDTAEVNAKLGEKDLSCALDAAAGLSVAIPAAEMARNEIRTAMFEMLN